MLKKVFLIVSIALLAYLGFEFRDTYMSTHSYYATMMADAKNWNIVLSGLLFSLLPASYLVYARKIRIKTLLLLFFLWLILFGFVFTTTKWWVGWFLMLTINSWILFGLAVAMFVMLTSVGDVIKRKVFGLETASLLDILMSMWVWLSVFLLFNYILISLGVFYPVVSWLQVIWVVCLMWYNRSEQSAIARILRDSLRMNGLQKREKIGLVVMICLTCLYLYLGFYLSDIAYSTAWDANHAYMFYPKMWALNNGYYWNEIWMATSFQLWYAFIAFWFSLFVPSGGILGISVDTIWISLNFWSGFFVILFDYDCCQSCCFCWKMPLLSMYEKDLPSDYFW